MSLCGENRFLPQRHRGHGGFEGLARPWCTAVLLIGGAMTIGVEDRRKVVAAAGLLLVAAVLLGRWVTGGSATSATDAPNTDILRSKDRVQGLGHGPVDPTLRLATLRDTEAMSYLGNGRD